jgi:cell division protein FtsQ
MGALLGKKPAGGIEVSDDTAPLTLPTRVGNDKDVARALVKASRARRRFERGESRRFTQRSRQRRQRLLAGGGIGAGILLLVVLIAYSPLFMVRTIDVVGTARIDSRAVSTALAGQLGRPLSLVDYGDIQRVLGGFSLIQSYSTESRPPNSLVVRITERTPAVAVPAAAGFDLIDPAGVLVEQSGVLVPGYPLIDPAVTVVGSPGFVAATRVLDSLAPELRLRVASISAPTPDSVSFVLPDAGKRVIWGSSERSVLKSRILTRLLAQAQLAGSVQIDVSSPEVPVLR